MIDSYQLNNQAAPSTPHSLNPQQEINNLLAQEYINTVRENRSLHGSYIDNNLAKNPHKEKKPMYDVVYETDSWNPWGKPGGGAPKIDPTGQVSTKIRGTLKWNLSKTFNFI
jgi:hypothetical protein